MGFKLRMKVKEMENLSNIVVSEQLVIYTTLKFSGEGSSIYRPAVSVMINGCYQGRIVITQKRYGCSAHMKDIIALTLWIPKTSGMCLYLRQTL